MILLGLQGVPPLNNSVNFRCEHVREFFHRCHHAKLLRMGVVVHGGLDVRVAHDGLQILYICVDGCERCERVPLWYIKDKPGKP